MKNTVVIVALCVVSVLGRPEPNTSDVGNWSNIPSAFKTKTDIIYGVKNGNDEKSSLKIDKTNAEDSEIEDRITEVMKMENNDVEILDRNGKKDSDSEIKNRSIDNYFEKFIASLCPTCRHNGCPKGYILNSRGMCLKPVEDMYYDY